MVRAAGIEPASQAWEARILPMYYARSGLARMEMLQEPVCLCRTYVTGSIRGRQSELLANRRSASVPHDLA